MPIKIPSICNKIGKIFIQNGFSCYLVGGAIRNITAGFPAKDYDLATDASPYEVMNFFKRVIPTGIKHGTVTVFFQGKSFEVTTFRVESNYTDSRRPDAVSYTPSIYEDLKRRDFTMNAMAYNLGTNELIDPHNGIKDLNNRVIRAIGNPVERFNEDGLRLLRACRFSSQLDFSIEDTTLQALETCRVNLERVSSERIRDEIIRTLESPKPSIGLKVMKTTRILEIILPELARCIGVQQKGYHQFDVFSHSVLACDMAPQENLHVRLAALFHDIGKPTAKDVNPGGEITFYNHEKISADITSRLLRRLRFSKKAEEYVTRLVFHHMFHYKSEWTDAAIRRFISRVGKDLIDDLLILRKADQFALSGNLFLSPEMKEFEARLRGILQEEHALTLKDLDINGKDIQREIGVPKGPVIGTILDELLQTVLDDPKLNKKETLLTIANNFYEQIIKRKD